MTDDEITIEVGGVAYGGWLSAQVVSSLDQAATQFALSVTEQYPGGATRIKPGDEVAVKIGGEIVCVGYVDKAPVSYSATGCTHSVSGRSKVGDIVDSCIESEIADREITRRVGGTATSGPARFAGVEYRADGTKVARSTTKITPQRTFTEYNRVDIRSAIASMIAPYGIELRSAGVEIKHVEKVSVSIGTKVLDAVRDLIKKSTLIATDDACGDLVLWSPDSAELASDDLVATRSGERTNVLSGSCGFDFSDVYGTYQVFGQADAGKASKNPAAGTNVRSIAVPSSVMTRGRMLRLFQSGKVDQAAVDARAAFERDYREANARACRYTVAGWRQSDGSLWRKGIRVHVADEILGLDEDMIIKSCTYTLDDSGTVCTIDVVPPEAFGSGE